MRKMKSLVLAVMGLLCCMSVSAEDFEVDGIYYNITSQADKTVAVTYRGDYYYSYDEYSGEVTIPESVTYNGNTYSVTSIGDEAFRDCWWLTSVEIGNSATSIGSYAFEGCSSLTSVSLNIKNIGDWFSNISSIKTIVLGDSVTSIGSCAFEGCSGLTSVEIGNSVTSIGKYAFHECSSLTSVEIGNSVTSIGEWAFRDCSSLTSIELPNSVTSIGSSTFSGCSSLTSIVVAPNNPKYDSRDNCNAIIESESNTLIAGCQNTTIPNSVTSIGDAAFEGCSSLTSVEIPNSVTSIGSSTFFGCSSLTSVEIPNSVISIGDYAFSLCSSLTSVEIGNSVTSIGNHAFYYCSRLTSVEIPNSVTSIGDEAYYGTGWYNNQPNGVIYAGKVLYKYKGTMPANTSITIEDGTVSISPKAFYSCSSLTSVDIPNSVTSIGFEAFYGTAWYNNQPDGVIYVGKVLYMYKGTMPANTSITIEDGTVSISPYAFSNCSRLTSVVIPNSVTSIGDYAFYRCSGLTSVVIPNSVTSIGYGVFADCLRLTSVDIPNSVTSIGDAAFSGCDGLTSVDIPNSVTSISDFAFSWCSSLTSVEIPNSVTSIGNYAFSGCSSLTSVEIGNSVTSIGSSAFEYCENLKKLISFAEVPPVCGWDVFYGVNTQECTLQVPEKSISAYQQADQWKEFHMTVSIHYFEADGIYYNITSQADKTVAVTYRGDYSYSYSNEYSGEVKIPESVTYSGDTYSVTSIGDEAFAECSSLTSVELPNSMTSIGNYAFSGCSSLTSVEMGNGVTSIGNNAFWNCSSLTSVELPNSVTSIGEGTFYQCSSLTSVELPNSVTSIGSSTFSGCASLTSIVVAPNNPKYDSRDNCNAIIESESNMLIAGCQNSTIPNSVTSIGSNAFRDCSSLTSVELPNSVTSIGFAAFYSCSSLTSVEIGNSMTSIGNYAFFDCENLKKLISYAEVPPVCGWDVFSGVNTQECTLQVPEKSISTYQQADPWRNFFFIEGVPTAIGGVTVDGAVPATADVYSVNGMLVKRNADLKNLKHELPAGIYIIGGKKVWVK